jgi:hypothetical protein
MLQRIMGVFMLNANTFEEIEHDTSATGQAAIVVTIVALLSAIGSGIGASLNPEAGGSFIGSFIIAVVATYIGWVLWSGITYLVGTMLFEGQADMGEMLRVIGFAFAPQVIGIIPFIGPCIGLIWTLLAVFVAVRQGLDLTTGKAIATILIGFVVYLVLLCGLLAVFGGLGAAIGSMSA